ncbi:WD40 repeat protein [Kitasatospora acidiphila]
MHDRVFPRLRSLCAEADAEFQAIDLRWGVSEGAVADQRVAEICLTEVDRCRQVTQRPNFLVLLGQRYGARPVPPLVDAALFRRLRARLTSEQAKLVDCWYAEDRNHVPAAFVLQPQRRGGHGDDTPWDSVERALSKALTAAALQDPAEPEALALLRTSITEQEILHGIPAGETPRHGAAFAFLRTIDGLPNDAAARPYQDVLDGQLDPEAAAAQERLRDRLCAIGAESLPVAGYHVAWNSELGLPTSDHIDRLCEDVYTALAEVIKDELSAVATSEERHHEEQAHRDFGAERRAHFTGRQDTIGRITGYLRSDDARPLVLVGEPGSGKTAVLAEVADRLVREGGCPLLVRFIGATPQSADLRTLLDDLRRNLPRLDRPLDSRPERPSFAAEAVRESLAAVPPDPGVVVVLDALDQLSGAPDLSWLPTELPRGVSVVLSAQEGSSAAAAAVEAGAIPLRLPGLGLADGGELLDQWLAEAGRSLVPEQRDEVLRAFAEHGNPLQLRLAFGEARRWASYTQVVRGSLTADVPGMTRRLLEWLEKEHGAVLVQEALSLLAVSRNGLSESELLDLLSANASVLREVAEQMPRSPRTGGMLPPVLWARLRMDLEPYLNVRRSEGRLLLGFYHRQLTEAVSARYLGENGSTALHRRLARYFGAQPVDMTGGAQVAANTRKLAELPYHQALSSSWDELYATLTDLGFLERKLTAVGVESGQGQGTRSHTGIYALQDDYELALRVWPQGAVDDQDRAPGGAGPSTTGAGKTAVHGRVLEQFARAMRLEAHTLAANPELAWQQVANRLQWEPDLAELVRAEARRRTGAGTSLVLRSRTRPPESESLIRRMSDGSDKRRLLACAFVPRTGLLAIADEQRSVGLWEFATGRRVRTLTGMSVVPQSCAATPDGRFVIATTGNPAGAVHVWEVRTGRQVAWRTAHDPACTACAVLPDGSAVLTFGTDGWIRRWSLPELNPEGELPAPEQLTCGAVSPTGEMVAYGGREGVAYVRRTDGSGPVAELVCGTGEPLAGVALGPDSRSLVTVGTADPYGLEGRVVLWDLTTRRRLQEHRLSSSVVDCALSADGSLLATPTDSGQVHLWALPGLHLSAVLNAHTTTSVGAALSPDGRVLASVSGDGTACVWDVAAARGSRLGGHDGLVQQCSFSRDGALLVTASVDGTVRRWETATGQEVGPAVEHPGSTVLMLYDDVSAGGGQIVLAAGDDGAVLRAELPSSAAGPMPAAVAVGEHGAQVWGLAPLTGGLVVTGGFDGSCQVWDVCRSVKLQRFAGDGAPVRACAAATDGAFVASGGDRGLLHLWDPRTGVPVTAAQQHSAAVTVLALGAGNTVAVADADGHIELTGLDTGWARRPLGRHPGSPVTALRWAGPDSVVSGGSDGSLAHWSSSANAPVWYREVHRGVVNALAVSPSGSIIISAGNDGFLVLSARTTGRTLARLPVSGRVHALSVHPREPLIACVGDGGLVVITEAEGWSGPW